jgi:hypothetical protein
MRNSKDGVKDRPAILAIPEVRPHHLNDDIDPTFGKDGVHACTGGNVNDAIANGEE